MHNKVSFSRAAHTSLDVMDRYTLLHVAYHLTPCGKWIIACCIDQRGENYELGVWLTHSPGEHEGETEHSDEEYAVKKVWDFAMQFARKTNVEWRVVFAKLGGLSLPEMEGRLSIACPHPLLIIQTKPGLRI
jgi:mediator of RNA polymerase II transcription subunit 13